MSLEAALAFAEGPTERILASTFDAIVSLRLLAGEVRRLQWPVHEVAPAVKLCKDCRWFEQRISARACMRPVPLEKPDYVMGTVSEPRDGYCMHERGAYAREDTCGPSGRYWAAKERG